MRTPFLINNALELRTVCDAFERRLRTRYSDHYALEGDANRIVFKKAVALLEATLDAAGAAVVTGRPFDLCNALRTYVDVVTTKEQQLALSRQSVDDNLLQHMVKLWAELTHVVHRLPVQVSRFTQEYISCGDSMDPGDAVCLDTATAPLALTLFHATCLVRTARAMLSDASDDVKRSYCSQLLEIFRDVASLVENDPELAMAALRNSVADVEQVDVA